MRVGEPWSRHAIGRVFNWIVKLLVLRGIDDTQCGFKLFSGRAAQALFPLQRLDGFGFDVEILFLARRAGFVIREIPVTWAYGRESKVNLSSGARGIPRPDSDQMESASGPLSSLHSAGYVPR